MVQIQIKGSRSRHALLQLNFVHLEKTLQTASQKLSERRHGYLVVLAVDTCVRDC